MGAYYNEFDPRAAAWLRELIKQKLIADGEVDERSILDVTADDLRSFTQCHFFAGIGGWSYALRLAGVSDDTPLWTGSPPCQPFSAAGRQRGKDDERHLAPHFIALVSDGRPPFVFGEQVASSAVFGKVAKCTKEDTGKEPEWAWLDDLSSRLEDAHYAVGATDIPAAGVGAPHIRQRTFFGAFDLERLDNTTSPRCVAAGVRPENQTRDKARLRGLERGRTDGWLADADRAAGREDPRGASGYEKAHGRAGRDRREPDADNGPPSHVQNTGTSTYHGGWAGADWLFCRDGKWRPVEPGTFPLAHGIPARVGRLRGYGNAIVPQAGAVFVKSFIEAARGAFSGPQ